MHQGSRLRHNDLAIFKPHLGEGVFPIKGSEGASYSLYPLRRLARYLGLFCKVLNWAERIQVGATPSGVEPVVRGYSLHAVRLEEALCPAGVQI